MFKLLLFIFYFQFVFPIQKFYCNDFILTFLNVTATKFHKCFFEKLTNSNSRNVTFRFLIVETFLMDYKTLQPVKNVLKLIKYKSTKIKSNDKKKYY